MAAALVACWLQVVAESRGGDRGLELAFEGVVVEAVGGVEGVAIDRVQFLQGSAVSGFALFDRGEAVVTPAVVEAGIAVVGRALGAFAQAALPLRGEKGVERLFEIGRASCRERGCQYVEISVVAVSLKKNKMKKTTDTGEK